MLTYVDFSDEACAERRAYLAQQRARQAAAERAEAAQNIAEEEAFKAQQRRLNRTR